MDDTIRDIRVLTVLAPLPTPVRFGNWVMRHREFAFCVARSHDGHVGQSFCYTRDGPIREIVCRVVSPHYVGESASRPGHLFRVAASSNNAVLASGIGHRALSLVDIAVWDLKAKIMGLSIEKLFGGASHPLPVTAIVGYPPTMQPDSLADQVSELYRAGWRRFKQPIAATADLTLERLSAAHDAAPTCWHGLDANWTFRSPDQVVDFCNRLERMSLGWIEDIFPPGNVALLVATRARCPVPIAMGDEQGGAHHPEALVRSAAVDVVRVDVTTNGGVTRFANLAEGIRSAGLGLSVHMIPHVHARLLSALGYTDVPIEWAVPGSGVDQYCDSLAHPVVSGGLMEPLPEEPGFGELSNTSWLADQDIDDPEGIMKEF